MATIVNGVEYKAYDKLLQHLEDVEKHFVAASEYNVLPPLPDNDITMSNLFKEACGCDEKVWMFNTLYTKLISAYRHWSVDLDALWTDAGRAKHEELIKKYEIVWKSGERNWSKFTQL